MTTIDRVGIVLAERRNSSCGSRVVLVNSGGVPWVVTVCMTRVLVQFLVSMTAEVKVWASPMTFRLCEIASEMRVRHAEALVAQQQRNEQEGE